MQRTPDAAVGNGGDGAHGHTAGSSAAGAVSRAMRYCSAAVEKGCSSSLQSAIALSRIVENILPRQQQHRTSHEDNASEQNSNTQVLESDEQKTLILTRSAPAGRKLFLRSAKPDGDHEAVAVGEEVLRTRSSRGGECGRGPKDAEITRL